MTNLNLIADLAAHEGHAAAQRVVEQMTALTAWSGAFRDALTGQHTAMAAAEMPEDAARRYATELHRIHKCISEAHDIQGQPGNWDVDGYMRGMFNGLELALSIVEGREPTYREAPEQYLSATPIRPGDRVQVTGLDGEWTVMGLETAGDHAAIHLERAEDRHPFEDAVANPEDTQLLYQGDTAKAEHSPNAGEPRETTE